LARIRRRPAGKADDRRVCNHERLQAFSPIGRGETWVRGSNFRPSHGVDGFLDRFVPCQRLLQGIDCERWQCSILLTHPAHRTSPRQAASAPGRETL